MLQSERKMRSLILIASVLAVPAIAKAQDQSAGPKERRAVVYLRETGSDQDVRAELIKFDASSVIIQVAGARRELPLTRVSRIEVPVRDSVMNGALIGALILGGWCAIICGQGLDRGSEIAPVAAFNAGMGALIGAGLDAMVQDRAAIYSSGPSTATRFGSLSPRLMFSVRLRF